MRVGGAGRTWLAAAAVLAAALWPAVAAGQNNALTVDSNTLTFPAPNATSFDTGHVEHPAGTTWTCTCLKENWQLSVRSLSANLGGYGKPLSHLQWRRADLGTWNAMTTTDVVVQTGLKSITSNTVHYRILLSWTADVPGNYGATIRYTIVKN